MFMAMSGSVYAAPSWWPIVPCGLNEQPAGATRMDTKADGSQVAHDFTKDCNQCDIILLFKNLIDLTTYGLVPVLGTFFFILGGFYILIVGGTGQPARVEAGKKLMKETAIGIAIILSSWLVTNMILKSVANDQIASTPWWQISCRVGSLKDITDASIPSVGTTPTSTPSTSGPPGTGTTKCEYKDVNLCVARPMSCRNGPCTSNSTDSCSVSSCAQYVPYINKYAGGAATANLLKAILIKESACGRYLDSGHAYGIMQIIPATANQFRSFCGLSAVSITADWLKTHPEESVCIAAAYIKSLAGGTCGTDVRNIAAGYNGGAAGACAASVSCAGEKDCSNDPMRKWECLYDDSQHTICNSGYNETRDYATKVLYCNNNPGF